MKSVFFLLLVIELVSLIQAQIINSGVKCADKKIIVDYHNDRRRLVSSGILPGHPKASNMQMLVWDDTLANIAQGWANKMVYKHNSANDLRFSIGENIYMLSSTATNNTFDWRQAINAWFSEYTIYIYAPVTANPGTGHYTQVVWANTMYVGCGAAHFKATFGFKSKLYVCNYGSAGNYIGQYPYLTGEGCNDLCCTNQCAKYYGYQC